MAKKFKKAQSQCQSHLFSLKPSPKQPISSRSLNLTLSFCSPDIEVSPESQNQAKCLEAPVFNNDGSFASAAFILPCDKNYYSARRSKMLEQHELRFTCYTDEKSELNVPKPKSKNCYCSVCRQYYEDYLDHIQSPIHKGRIASSTFSKHIDELTKTFSQHRALKGYFIEPRTTTEKPIIIEALSDESDEVEIISNPYKKLKTSETNTAKESNTALTPKVQQPISQPYYPFYPWFSQEQMYNQSNPFTFNFNFNFAMNPFSYSQTLPLSQAIPPAGFQPFHMAVHNCNMLGFGPLSNP